MFSIAVVVLLVYFPMMNLLQVKSQITAIVNRETAEMTLMLGR